MRAVVSAPAASSLTGVEIDRRRFCVFSDRQAAYLVVSKVACTSIKTALGRSYGIEPEVPHAIHGREHFRYCEGELPPDCSEYFTFAFVRNPFDRLVSCYRDKVLHREGDALYAEPYFRDYPYAISPNMAFRDFARAVREIPDRFSDRHFKSQAAILCEDGVLIPDFVGRFESLARDWATVAQRFGFEDSLVHLHSSSAVSSTGSGVRPDFRSYYSDPETVELVFERYREDVERFGYGAAPEELLGSRTEVGSSASNVYP